MGATHHKEFLFLAELCARWKETPENIRRLIVQRHLPRAYVIQGKARLQLDPGEIFPSEDGSFEAHILMRAVGDMPPDPTRIAFGQVLVVYPTAGDRSIELRGYSSVGEKGAFWPKGTGYLSFWNDPAPAIGGLEEPWFYIGDIYDFEERQGITCCRASTFDPL